MTEGTSFAEELVDEELAEQDYDPEVGFEFAVEEELSEDDADFVQELVVKTLEFAQLLCDMEYYPYQYEFAYRVVESLVLNDGEEITALFSRQCLDGDTVVFRRDGSACRLREHGDAWSTGVKPTKRYKMRGGAEIVATDNHPVMTDRGWVQAGLLRVGDRVSVMQSWGQWNRSFNDQAKAKILGYFATDGTGGFGTQTPKFTNTRSEYLEEFSSLMEKSFGITPKRYAKGNGFDLVVSDGRRGKSVNPFSEWLRSLEFDHGFPTEVFRWDPVAVADFINRAWSGDGCISMRKSGPDVFLACGNDEVYARYWQSLLLKLGVSSSVKRERMSKGTGTFHRLVVGSGAVNIRRFFEVTGLIYGKEAASAAALEWFDEKALRAPGKGRAERKMRPVHAHGLDGEALTYAPIVSIEDAGEREVFDVTYEHKGWFVAQGVQVHNSGKTNTVASVIATVMVLFPRLAKTFTMLEKFQKGVMVGVFGPVDDQAATLWARVVGFLTSDKAMQILLDPEIDDVPTKSREGRSPMLTLKKCGSFCRQQTANPRAKIESKSYHFIVIDECQEADEYVIRKSIHPMGAFYNATIVKTGTPSRQKGDFYKAIQHNKRRQTRARAKQNHFQFDWRYCNTPDAPIWMGDYSFKPLGDVVVGDEVIGWEWSEISSRYGRWEGKETTRKVRTRHLTKAKVTEIYRRESPIVKVTLASGRVIRCTPDHWWLSGKSGGDHFVNPDVGKKLVRVVDPTPPLAPENEKFAYWLGGVWDGEGTTFRIAQSQEKNPEVHERIGKALSALGIEYTEEPERYYMRGGRQTLTNFLNWCDPAKRTTKWVDRDLLRTKVVAETDEIVSVEHDGYGEVISMTTTTGNYIAWGYASKNCARSNDNYAKFVKKEMKRLGQDSDEFQLAFEIRWLLDRGMLITSQRLDELGDVSMKLVPSWTYSPVVVGIDPAKDVDSTVVTVVYVDWDRPDEFGFYEHRILNWLELHQDAWEEQYFQISEFLRYYWIGSIAVDKQGVGSAVADRIERLFPRIPVLGLDSTRPAQTARWTHLMQLIDRNKVIYPAHSHVRRLRKWKRFYQQMTDVEKRFQGPHIIIEAPEDDNDAHDDYVDSLALACAMTRQEDIFVPEIEVTANPFYSR